MPTLSYMIIEQYVQVFGDQLFSWATSVLKHQVFDFQIDQGYHVQWSMLANEVGIIVLCQENFSIFGFAGSNSYYCIAGDLRVISIQFKIPSA